MLVLTRKKEQKIRIGKDVKITVLKIQGNQVSIGIEAPKNMQIVREELILESDNSDSFSESEMSTLR
ncbi:MAG: carbon storage regulator [Victivallaceae bacterium]